MILKPVAEIRDPVHGYIKVTEVERNLVDSPFVQRLRRVHQLAGSYLVYPGAVHTRFEHVLGTMHMAGEIAESIMPNSGMVADQVQEVRLAGLLHDVGHGPFSHIYEEVLAEKGRVTHEDISQRIIRHTSIRDVLERNGFSARRLSSLAVGRQVGSPHFMNEIIAGGLSADIMDYLLRDSYFTGVEYGKVDVHRVVDSLQVSEGHLVLDDAALYAFEALLLARYEMFKAVYFHRTVRAAELMIVRSMILADNTLGLTDLSDIDNFLSLTDEVVLYKLATLRSRSSRLREARTLAVDLGNRRLVKCAFERLVQRRDKVVGQLLSEQATRDRVISELAREARVDKMHIYLDVPTTPSIPYTPSKEVLASVRLVQKQGGRQLWRTVPLSELPLVGSIAGFMDVVRVYTQPQFRDRVQSVATHLFNRGAFTQS